jgi:hypothetical protein
MVSVWRLVNFNLVQTYLNIPLATFGASGTNIALQSTEGVLVPRKYSLNSSLKKLTGNQEDSKLSLFQVFRSIFSGNSFPSRKSRDVAALFQPPYLEDFTEYFHSG